MTAGVVARSSGTGGSLRPDSRASAEYLEAFTKIVQKIAEQLGEIEPKLLPIRLYVAGGAALHLRTGPLA